MFRPLTKALPAPVRRRVLVRPSGWALLPAILLAAVPAEAYIGPGAGFAVGVSVLAMLWAVLSALAAMFVWPMRYAIAHWAALLTAPAAGQYELCCRTIDASGIAQPLPRPLPKSGRNEIQCIRITVKA